MLVAAVLLLLCSRTTAAASARDHVHIAGMDGRLITGIICGVTFLAIPVVSFVYLRRRQVAIPAAAAVFLVCAAACGISYACYVVLFLFDQAYMRIFAITALILMFVTFVTLLPLVPALIALYDPERERLAVIVDSSRDAIIGKDAKGYITSWNRGAERLYGYSAEEAIGAHIRLIVPQHRREELDRILARIEDGEYIENLETERIAKDGSRLDIALTISPLRDRRGRIGGASVIGRDVTEIRRVERMLRHSNEALDDFAYVASHDLKSPLRGIDNLCRFIAEDLGDTASEEVLQHLSQMHGRVHRMERLLDDLLEYSRVGRVEHKTVKLRVADLITNVTRLLDIPDTFNIRTRGELPELTTLATPLEQIFRNLVHNAVKHHDQGRGTVTISAQLRDEWVEFTVADDGPGIPPEFRERIFRPFTTLAPRDKVEGSGIGLSLVAKLARHYGGRVWLEGYAEGQRGAVFKFTWPQHVMGEAL